MFRRGAADEPPCYITARPNFRSARFTLCRWQRMTILLRITAVFLYRGIGDTIDSTEGTCLK